MELIEGIVINSRNYQENSKLISVLTKQNMTTLAVKASCSYSSKNYSAALEMNNLNYAISESKGNSFSYLKSFEIIDSYKYLKNDYDALYELVKIYNIIYRYHEHIDDYNNLFQLTKFITNGFNETCKNKENKLNKNVLKLYEAIFLVKLLYLFGVGPNFKSCTVCESKNAFNFSISLGGLVCDKCTANDKLKGDYISLLKILYTGKINYFNYDFLNELSNKVDDNIINDLFKLLISYYDKYLSIKIS